MVIDEDAAVVAFDVLDDIFEGDELFPPLVELELFPSLLAPLLEPEFPPVLLDDNTILRGGTFRPLPADEPDTESDFPETFEELSLSSFSLSEWSRLWGFLGLFVADVDPDEEDGLFRSFLSDDPLPPPLPFPVNALPKSKI